jgi:membrane protease YdiL (CAAX protease family)
MKIIQRLSWFLVFLACGLLIFVVFSHYHPLLASPADGFGRIAAALVFFTAAWFVRRNEKLKVYWLIPFAFFTALAAISLDYYLGLSKWILPALGISGESPAGWGIDKLESSLLGISVILVLNRLAGQKAEGLYIRKGNLRLGLLIGFIAFAVMVASVIPVTEWFFRGKDLSWGRILPWAPWVLIMVLLNAAFEELVFRGLLIGKMEPFLGRFATNIATTIPFVLMHAFTSYSTDQGIFLALQLLPLSLAWCWLMQKSNSIWGSLLFHAAMDIPVFVGIFSNL